MNNTDKEVKLENCPCCKGDAIVGRIDATPDTLKAVEMFFYYVTCTICGLTTAEYEYITPQHAAEAWNTRAPTVREQELDAVIAEQDKLLKAAYDSLQAIDEALRAITNIKVDGKRIREYSDIALIARGRAAETILKTGLYFDGYVEKITTTP